MSFLLITLYISQIESYQWPKKWYLMPPCLTLCIIRYGSSVRWSNLGKRVASSPTPQCNVGDHSRGWPKGSLFNSYYTEVERRALILSLEYSTYPWSVPYNAFKQGGIKYHFWVFGMTRPGIELRSPGSLAKTLLMRPSSSYWKRSLRVNLYYDCQLTCYIYAQHTEDTMDNLSLFRIITNFAHALCLFISDFVYSAAN